MRRILTCFALLFSVAFAAEAGNVKGRVTSDGHPMEGVWVSDGVNMVRTDEKGRFEFDSDKSLGIVFIEIPSGNIPESKDGLRPDFWHYFHLPPDKEEVHDFALKSECQEKYNVILCTDFHLNNDPRKKDLAQFAALVTPLARKIASEAEGPVYTFHLGDLTQDIFWYEWGFNEAEGVRFLQEQRWPGLFYSVTGNHDNDGAVGGVEDVDRKAWWMYRDCFGPDRFSWNIGKDHWIFLDDIIYMNERNEGMIMGPNIHGSQNYVCDLRDDQLEWLRNDLSHVDKDTRVYVCTHSPLMSNNAVTGKTEAVIPSVAAALETLAMTFSHEITVFSGHLHQFDFCQMEQYPHIRQVTLPATSGDQWKAPIGMHKAEGDGSPAGMMVVNCSESANPALQFWTLFDEFHPYRVYDLNVVGKAYGTSEGFKVLKKKFPSRNDYSESRYSNCVLVNYWYARPGDKVELLENGTPLPVVQGTWEDPVAVFQKDVAHIFSDQSYPSPKEGYCVRFHNIKPHPAVRHAFMFRSRTATGGLHLRITAPDGTVRYEEDIVRPIAFDHTLTKR